MDDIENIGEEELIKERISYQVKKRNMKRRWRDEDCRTGGYSRAKFRDVGMRIAMDQMDAENEF